MPRANHGQNCRPVSRARRTLNPKAKGSVTLPLAFGFNVLLARETGRQFWPWFALGNLHLLPAALMVPFHEG